jgi:hypothetical protein
VSRTDFPLAGCGETFDGPGGIPPAELNTPGAVCRPVRKLFRNNGLSIVLILIFLLAWLGQSLTGHHKFLADQKEHGQPPISYLHYLGSEHFWEATAENWESEFLQMFMYVALTAFLFQKGSAESKDPDSKEEKTPPVTPDSPWPARKGGWALKLYEHSLSAAFLGAFLVSFAMHALAGARSYNVEQRLHGEPEVSTLQYLHSYQFWFESFQNWQSEFLAIFLMVVLSIYLREKSSPESKPVQMPNRQNPE